jgi:hypothetical protein
LLTDSQKITANKNQFRIREFNIIFVLLMKQIIALIAFFCYFAASSGVIINSHYCMKRLVYTHLFETKSKVCGKCGMKMHKAKGCCHDETKVVKLVQDQNKMPVVSYDLTVVKQLPVLPSDFIAASFYNFFGQPHFEGHSPPLLEEQDTYLQNCVFRI